MYKRQPQNERFLVHQKFNQTVEEDEEIPMQIADDLNEYVNDHIIYKIVVSHNDTSYLDKVAEVIKKETDADAIRSGKKVLAVKARGVSKAEDVYKRQVEYTEMLLYYFKYRQCDPKTLELLIESFKMGGLVH